MRAIRTLTRWLDRRRDSIWTQDLERDWRRWSRAERIAASLLAITIALAPLVLIRP